MGYNSRYNPSQGGQNPTRSAVNKPASRALPADRPEAPSTNPSANTSPEQLRKLSLESAASGLPSPDLIDMAFSARGY